MATNKTKTESLPAMRQYQGHNLAKREREGPFFATTFSRPFKDQSGAWRNGTSFGLNDLEALMNVALEAKECIAAPCLETLSHSMEAFGPPELPSVTSGRRQIAAIGR